MTRFQDFEHAYKTKGWRYDRGDEAFYDGQRIVDWEELICLVPDFTLDELTAYVDARNDRRA